MAESRETDRRNRSNIVDLADLPARKIRHKVLLQGLVARGHGLLRCSRHCVSGRKRYPGVLWEQRPSGGAEREVGVVVREEVKLKMPPAKRIREGRDAERLNSA